jgi:antirestriction protein ArdC
MNSYNLTSSPPQKKKKKKKERKKKERQKGFPIIKNSAIQHFSLFFFCKIDGLPSNFGKNTHLLALFLVLA